MLVLYGNDRRLILVFILKCVRIQGFITMRPGVRGFVSAQTQRPLFHLQYVSSQAFTGENIFPPACDLAMISQSDYGLAER